MKLKINRYWFDFKEEQIWIITIKKQHTDLWYKEISKRFWILSTLKTEEEKQEFLNKTWCYDIDETYECWTIWLPHLIELLTFIKDING